MLSRCRGTICQRKIILLGSFTIAIILYSDKSISFAVNINSVSNNLLIQYLGMPKTKFDSCDSAYLGFSWLHSNLQIQLCLHHCLASDTIFLTHRNCPIENIAQCFGSKLISCKNHTKPDTQLSCQKSTFPNPKDHWYLRLTCLFCKTVSEDISDKCWQCYQDVF